MTESSESSSPSADLFTEMLRIQGETARQLVAGMMPPAGEAAGEDAMREWGQAALKLQQQWLEFHESQVPQMPVPIFADPTQWLGMMQGWYQALPLLDPARQAEIWQEGMSLWEDILAQYGIGP